MWQFWQPCPAVGLSSPAAPLPSVLPKLYYLYTDGSARGNNSKANSHGGAGAVIYNDQMQELWTLSQYLGSPITNIVAEYTALILGLQQARRMMLPQDQLIVRFDLDLMYKQLTGEWRSKEPHITKLKWKVQKVLYGCQYQLEWIPREQNDRANDLAQNASKRR